MPFVQRMIEPRLLSRTGAEEAAGFTSDELLAVSNTTLGNALRQLASLVLAADDIFAELGGQLQAISRRSDALRDKIRRVEERADAYDPKTVAVPESDICTFALLKDHYKSKHVPDTNLFTADTRPQALRDIYEAASKTPVVLMRQMDRWRRDGHRSSRFFMCTPILGGSRRRRLRNKIDIDIETSMPAIVKDLRKWTSSEAVGDITVTTDCPNRIASNTTIIDDAPDGSIADEAIDHTLPSPEEQLQVFAQKFPAEVIAVDVSGRSFHRMSSQRRSLLPAAERPPDEPRRRRRPRHRRRNTLAGTDQKEIRDALTLASPPASPAVPRSKSSDLLRPKACSPTAAADKKSHFASLRQWGRSRFDRLKGRCAAEPRAPPDIDDFSLHGTVRRRHERNPSISSSEKSAPAPSPLSSVVHLAVKLREASALRRGKDEPHSSSGNWSASSGSARASIGSEFTAVTTQPKSTASSNSLSQPGSALSRRRFNLNTPTSSATSEGTLTPDIIHDLHEDGETSSVYSCDTEGYYTSFHMDSGLKTLKEEELPCTPLHSTTALGHLSAESEYELFGKGSTSTTASSAGTVCTTFRTSPAACPPPPERTSSLKAPAGDTGTVKRSPAARVGDVSPDSGHNTSSSPIESINSPNGVRSGSEFEFSESSDMEGTERCERIRAKTTINSSRIPSMCVITPPQSDDDSVNSYGGRGSMNGDRKQLGLDLNANGARLDVGELRSCDSDKENVGLQTRTVTVRNRPQLVSINPQSGYASIEDLDCIRIENCAPSLDNNDNVQLSKSITAIAEPSPKAPLIRGMLGRLRTNLAHLTHRRDPSPAADDVGDYVTLADARNNNAPTYANAPSEYVELDSLERRQGARVTLDADGRVAFSSASLQRRKAAHSTFEPGACVRLVVRPGAAEAVRVPAATIVAGAAAAKAPRGAYVHLQEDAAARSPTHDTDRVPSSQQLHHPPDPAMYNYRDFGPEYTFQRSGPTYQTLPAKRPHITADPERSVTPDITRGLKERHPPPAPHNQLGIPAPPPAVSPIDPRRAAGVRASTPTRRPTMTHDELYAVIHKVKKKMSIEPPPPPPVELELRAQARLSWSPAHGEYVDFARGLSPPRRPPAPTSRLDFKKLLLQKSASNASRRVSAVEQLRLSRQQSPPPAVSIRELSGSPRSLVNRKFGSPQGSPARDGKPKAAPKLMSPRSQWRFANPRSDVLSSTILEDCREDDSPNNSMEKRRLAMQAQRAQFFGGGSPASASPQKSPQKGRRSFDCQNADGAMLPTLETAF